MTFPAEEYERVIEELEEVFENLLERHTIDLGKRLELTGMSQSTVWLALDGERAAWRAAWDETTKDLLG